MAVAVCLLTTSATQACLYTYTSGNRSATVDFKLAPGVLTIDVKNTSTADVLTGSDVLTTIFFEIKNDPKYPKLAALLGPGSTVIHTGSQPAGGVIGGEWGYQVGFVGGSGTIYEAISAFMLTDNDRFPGPVLAQPTAPTGLDYGLTSAGDNPNTGDATLTNVPLIKNEAIFTLAVPSNFKTADIGRVRFHYGDLLCNGQQFEATLSNSVVVPEPTSIGLLAGGMMLLGLRRGRRVVRAS